MTGICLILRGIAGTFDGVHYPHGALDEPSACAYARARGYEPVVLDCSGETGDNSRQVHKAIDYIRVHDDVAALYGFSGGYNVLHILEQMSGEERSLIKLVVVLGAPNNSAKDYAGHWETVYRKDPPSGHHMDSPRFLLAELEAKRNA